jgi:hypothetical protein
MDNPFSFQKSGFGFLGFTLHDYGFAEGSE